MRTITCMLLMYVSAVTAYARELPEFMIFTYGVDLTEKTVKILADAGFNTVYGPADKISLCREYGLKLMIPHPGLDTARKLRGNPDVWGYDIMDEPISLKQLYEAADSVRAYHEADPTHLTFVNLNQKAGHWIPFFIETVKPDFLSYDEYQWWYGGIYEWFTGSKSLFVKIEQHRDEALAAGLPLTIWREVNVQRNVPGEDNRNRVTPPDNAPKIRQNIYSSLVYGVKGILWFYGPLLFDQKTGEFNETGRQVADINAELQKLGPVLFRLTSIGVFHTPPVPKGSREVSPDHWIQPAGDELVIGTFRDPEKREYVMVVNRDWQHEHTATLQFPLFLQVVESVELFDRQTGEWKPLRITGIKDTRDRDYVYNFDNIPQSVKDYITYNHKALNPKELSFFELYHTYRPPYQVVSLTLSPGDGELLRISLKDGEDIPDPR